MIGTTPYKSTNNTRSRYVPRWQFNARSAWTWRWIHCDLVDLGAKPKTWLLWHSYYLWHCDRGQGIHSHLQCTNSVLCCPDLYFGTERFLLPATQEIVSPLISATSPFLDLFLSEDSHLAKGHALPQRHSTTDKGTKIPSRSFWILELTYFIPGDTNRAHTQDDTNALSFGGVPEHAMSRLRGKCPPAVWVRWPMLAHL